MKKLQILFTVLLLLMVATGCGFNRNDENSNNDGIPKSEDTKRNDLEDNTAPQDGMGKGEQATGDQTPATDQRIELAEESADKVAEMEEVQSANVLVTNKNAYVGVVLKEGVNGDKKLEEQIAEVVRNSGKDFQQVYVSFNPDIVKQINDYGDKVRAGEPVEGLFKEFSDTMKRLFPNAQ